MLHNQSIKFVYLFSHTLYGLKSSIPMVNKSLSHTMPSSACTVVAYLTAEHEVGCSNQAPSWQREEQREKDKNEIKLFFHF